MPAGPPAGRRGQALAALVLLVALRPGGASICGLGTPQRPLPLPRLVGAPALAPALRLRGGERLKPPAPPVPPKCPAHSTAPAAPAAQALAPEAAVPTPPHPVAEAAPAARASAPPAPPATSQSHPEPPVNASSPPEKPASASSSRNASSTPDLKQREKSTEKPDLPTSSTEPAGQDYTKEAIAFFETERTHTALFTAVSVSMLWVLPISASSSASDGFVRRAYHWFAGLAVVNSILTVFTCAVAIPRLMCRRHALNAASPFNLLLRERPLRLYYLSVRTHSLSGILCFCTALSIRMWYEYSTGCWQFARAMAALVVCATAHMMSLLMASLTTFSPHINSFGSLWRNYFQELLAAGCITELNAANIVTLSAGAFVIYDSLSCFFYQFNLAFREVQDSISTKSTMRFSAPSGAPQEDVDDD